MWNVKLFICFSFIFPFVVGNKECSPSQSVCEYWLSVEERLTMTWNNIRVYAQNGSLLKWTDNSKVPVDDVVTVDGIDRGVITVNKTIPGPPLVVYEGQELLIHVRNHLLSESITIHWHGLHQRDTPFMDGVAFITQCPIGAGQRFTYKFKAYPRGTFWYHSHIGGQRVDGLHGALIIKPKPNPAAEVIDEHIMHVSDWFHDQGSTLHARMIYGNFKSQKDFVHPKTLDGVYFAPLIYKSAIVEGRGQYKDPDTGLWNQSPLKSYNVSIGKKYRFRVIGSGMIYPFRISIDNHMLTVVSSDGYDIKPREFQSFVINPGERFDFIITADQPAESYWIRIDGMEVDFEHHDGKAILQYENSPFTEPKSTRMNCTQEKPCVVLNCQFSYYPKDQHTTCIRIDQLDGQGGESAPSFDENSEEHFLNFVQGQSGMVVNGKNFEHPAVSSLTQNDDVSNHLNCNRKDCIGADATCYCQHELKVAFNKTIQMIWLNHGKGATRHHPIHMHGHSFHVLKIGYAKYNETNGLLLAHNEDIDCGNTSLNYCYQPSWKNKNWENGNIPGLKIMNAPQKDTLMIPVGAYAVIRFKSDNPGKWFLHCHIEFHAMQGMALILNEAEKQHPSPPKGFPVCQNFHSDPNVDTEYVKKDEIIKTDDNKDDDDDVKLILIIVIAVLGGFLLLENLLLLLRYCVQKKSSSKSHEINAAYSSSGGEVKL